MKDWGVKKLKETAGKPSSERSRFFYLFKANKMLPSTCGLILLLLVGMSYSDNDIADAIYKAEGGAKAKKPFGILSVECNGYNECRQICLNTIKNNRKRYADYGHKEYGTFLEFLASRYAPVEAHPLNRHWLKNVRWFLENTKT